MSQLYIYHVENNLEDLVDISCVIVAHGETEAAELFGAHPAELKIELLGALSMSLSPRATKGPHIVLESRWA